jgi:magnesium transporter
MQGQRAERFLEPRIVFDGVMVALLSLVQVVIDVELPKICPRHERVAVAHEIRAHFQAGRRFIAFAHRRNLRTTTRRRKVPAKAFRARTPVAGLLRFARMFRKRYSKPGSAPATLNPLPGPVRKPVLRVMEYHVNGFEERTVASVDDLPLPADDGKIHWIEMNGIGDVEALRALGQKYGLHPLALEDVLNIGQRPKAEVFDEQIFLVAQMIHIEQEPHELIGEQVSIFVQKNFLISIQEDDIHDVFEPVRIRIRAGGGFIRKMKADYLAYALLDSIMDHVFPVLEDIGEAIEELEDVVLTNPGRSTVGEIHGLRRVLMQIRRFVWPERDVVASLLHSDCPTIRPETKVFLRDLYDHSIQIMDLVESYRDVTTSLFEMYLSAVGLRTNEIMRLLTVISAIFIPLTFIVGLYGMNFQTQTADGQPAPTNMPELHWRYGYLGVLVLMALIAGGQLYLFKKKKWL